MNVNDEINALLQRIEAQRGVRILYACESGSRAWGFASPDSDYDIRFIFVRQAKSYLSVREGLDSIDLPMEGELDAGGWDLRKALNLLGKSNGSLVEWLHSPIIYREEPGFTDRWRSVAADVFSPRANSDHYRGLAKQMLRGKLTGAEVRAKDYLYALRAILAASWVMSGKGIAPVPFADLLGEATDALRAEIPALLEHKARTGEGKLMQRNATIDDFLETRLAELDAAAADLGRSADPVEKLDRLLHYEIRMSRTKVAEVADFTLSRVRSPDMLMFDSIAGSHAFGTAIEGSDQDRRGVFVAPADYMLGLNEIEQVSDERGDEVYYEIGRFMELLLKNNPNALELLGVPDDCVIHRHPLFERLKPELFLSKLCARTFGEYAMGQIRKARGLNKKIVNPEPEQRKAMLEFCHVPEGQGSVPVLDWLVARGIDPKTCGITAVRHAAGMFAIYHGTSCSYRGLVSPKDPDSLVFSSVPIDAVPMAWMHFNQDAFQAHCKAHREYWEWVANRNEERYANNASHGRGYDSKNLMHTLRLLDMAGEIATEGVIRVRRPNRDFLLRVRAGEFEYDDLVARADEKMLEIKSLFNTSPLPDEPDRAAVNDLLVEIRAEF